MMPTTSPRTSGVVETNWAPSRSIASRPGAASRRSALRPEISGMRKATVNAVSSAASPLTTSARYTVVVGLGCQPAMLPDFEISANAPAALITATP